MKSTTAVTTPRAPASGAALHAPDPLPRARAAGARGPGTRSRERFVRSRGPSDRRAVPQASVRPCRCSTGPLAEDHTGTTPRTCRVCNVARCGRRRAGSTTTRPVPRHGAALGEESAGTKSIIEARHHRNRAPTGNCWLPQSGRAIGGPNRARGRACWLNNSALRSRYGYNRRAAVRTSRNGS